MRDAWTVLESPGLARLWAAARRKIEREGGVSGSVSLADLAPEERRAIAGLLGRPQGQGGRERVDLAQLDAVLRRSAVGQGLPEVLERFGGPLRDRGAEARRAEAERRAALARSSSIYKAGDSQKSSVVAMEVRGWRFGGHRP